MTSLRIAGMNQHTCAWIFLSSLDEKREHVCGDPVDGGSRNGPAHPKELLSFIARENAEKQSQEQNPVFSVITRAAGIRTRESS